MKKDTLITIQNTIDYRFNNTDLLQQAFTRRSYAMEHGGECNEVLEFIGDKVLDLIVVKLLTSQNSNANELYKKFEPNAKTKLSNLFSKLPEENIFISNYTEAELTEIKKTLVQKSTLARRIDDLHLAEHLLMGKGDILQNINEERSVKEDLFEAILGAIAIDSNWDMDALQIAVITMLAPETILENGNEKNYPSLIQEWTKTKIGADPLYHIEKKGFSHSMIYTFNGISQRSKNYDDQELYKTKYHCYLQVAGNLPNFRGFGQTETEAKTNACKLAYEYLCTEGHWLSICDEIEDPNKEDAINQLEILARRGYFSIPTYEFEQTYDKDGNPIWKSVCRIAEKKKSFAAKSSSKKDAKKSAAFKMLQYVLED